MAAIKPHGQPANNRPNQGLDLPCQWSRATLLIPGKALLHEARSYISNTVTAAGLSLPDG